MPPPCGDAGRPVSPLDEVLSFLSVTNKSTFFFTKYKKLFTKNYEDKVGPYLPMMIVL